MNEEAARAAFDSGKLGREDLIIVDVFPQDAPKIPPVAGIITSSEFLPRSHVTDLAKRMQIPVVHIDNVMLDPVVLQLQNEGTIPIPRVLEVAELVDGRESTFTIRLANEEELALQPVIHLPKGKIDKKFSGIETIETLMTYSREFLRLRYGEKAANLIWAFRSIPEANRPKLIALPLGMFLRFLREASYANNESLEVYVTDRIAKAMEARKINPAAAAEHLMAIQAAIRACKMPPDMIGEIVHQMRSQLGNIWVRHRNRTSNPIEDSLGAGVYDSTILEQATHSDEDLRSDEIEKMLKESWASEFSPSAFEIRQRAGVDELNEAMATIIQVSREGQSYTAVSSYKVVNGTIIFESTVVQGANSATSPAPGIPYDNFRVTVSPDGRWNFTDLNSDMTGGGYGPDSPQFLEIAELSLQFIDVKGIIEGMKLFAPVHTQFKEEMPSPSLSFEWINVVSAPIAGGTTVTENIPIPLQVKTPGENVPSRLALRKIPEVDQENIKNKKRIIDLDLMLTLLPPDIMALRDFVLAAPIDATGTIRDVSYASIKLNGFSVLLLGPKTTPVRFLAELRDHFKEARTPFTVVDVGTIESVHAEALEHRLVLSNLVAQSSVQPTQEEISVAGTAAHYWEVVESNIRQQIVVEDLVDFAPGTKLNFKHP
jgi:hypothetical protein